MEDSVKLDALKELDLVLIAYSDASQTQADELATAARTGSTIQAPTLFKLRSLSFSSILLDLVPQQPVVQIDLQAGGGTAAAAPVRLLLDAAANPNLARFDGTTALIAASGKEHHEVVRLLLDAAANPNLARNDGTTALMEASCRGSHEVVRVLLDAAADTNLARNDGTTALIAAFCSERIDVIRLLLDVATEKSCTTALTVVSRQGHIEVVPLLPAAGADSSTKKRSHDVEVGTAKRPR